MSNFQILDEIFDDLFPIARSITGPGFRQSLDVLGRYIPLTIHEVPTGEKVGDWLVPQEWKLNRAILRHESGKVVVDTNHSNLQLLNFSIPYNGTLDLEELQKNLYSIPHLPNAVPYVTSYYEPRWGFCLSDNERNALLPGKYEVAIDTEITDGHLNFATVELIGKSEKTILISTYLCHPSLANNELSGPLSLVHLYRTLSKIENRRFTYKFVIAPETIGAIAFLERNASELRKKMFGGLVLTCLGGDSEKLSLKLSRRASLDKPSQLDVFVKYSEEFSKNLISRPFTPLNGSDERHYCSPLLNLPMLQVARTVYGEYEGYHNSLDTKEFMSVSTVQDSADQILDLLLSFESASKYPISTTQIGEPQLGRRGLYPTINFVGGSGIYEVNQTDKQLFLDQLLEIISLSDGTNSLAEIGLKLQIPWKRLSFVSAVLEENELIYWSDECLEL